MSEPCEKKMEKYIKLTKYCECYTNIKHKNCCRYVCLVFFGNRDSCNHDIDEYCGQRKHLLKSSKQTNKRVSVSFASTLYSYSIDPLRYYD